MRPLVRRPGLLAVVVVALAGIAAGVMISVRGSSTPGPAPFRAAPCTVTVSEDLVNSCRPWYGAAVNRYPNVDTRLGARVEDHEQRTGRKLDIVHNYNPVGDNHLSPEERRIAMRAGTILFLNWKPARSWAQAAGGDRTIDAGIDRMAESVRSLGEKKILLTLHHEPESDVSGGGDDCPRDVYRGHAGTPAAYRAMWRNVQRRFRAKRVRNVVWAIDYMNYERWDCLVDDVYPGDDLVDWVMFNAYGSDFAPDFSDNVQRFIDLLDKLDGPGRRLRTKHWGIGEWGVSRTSLERSIEYYKQAREALERREFPQIKAWVVFDAIGPDGWDHRVAYHDGVPAPEKARRYRRFARSPVFSVGD
jgi:hypothetical protein